MIELNFLQIFLISCLIIIAPLGFLNQKRMAKKKAKMMQNYTYNPNLNNESQNINEQKAQDYILQYKSTYSRESIKSGLISMGISDSEAEAYLGKYL